MGINNVGIDMGKVAPLCPIERPSFGRGCIGLRKIMLTFRGVQAAAGTWATMAVAK